MTDKATKASVLIVDDEDMDRYLLKRDLEELSLEVVAFEASNGTEAMEFLDEFEQNQEKHAPDFPPRLIFLDINMPLFDGHEFLEAFASMRTVLPLQNTVVVMFTSSKNADDIALTNTYEFVVGYLVKGEYEMADLEKAISNAALPAQD